MVWRRRAHDQHQLHEQVNLLVAITGGIHETTQRLEQRLNHIESLVLPNRRQPALAIVAVALLCLAIWLLTHGTKGFSRPDAVSTNFGGVTVGVAIPEPSSSDAYPFPSAVEVGIAASFDSDDSQVRYTLLFPKDFAGRDFVLVLEGSAILKEASSTTKVVVHAARGCREEGGKGQYHYSIEHRCQLIRGRIPSRGEGSAPCQLDVPQGLDFDQELAIPVTVEGEAHFVQGLDWAHSLVTLPSTVGAGPPTAMREWLRVPLGGWFGTPLQLGCKVAATPTNATVTEMADQPTSINEFWMRWEGEDAEQQKSYVVTDRGAETNANAFLALSGIVGGLGLGLFGAALTKRR